jgi:DNA-binding NarL/FixJ family response regulator
MRPAARVRDPTGVPFSCLIVDDNASFLDAAAGLLEREGVMIAGMAFAAAEALRKTRELHPDVVLVDIMLGRESGIDLAYRLAEASPDGPVIILISTHAEADFTDLIREAPVAGFIPKLELSASAIRRLAGTDHPLVRPRWRPDVDGLASAIGSRSPGQAAAASATGAGGPMTRPPGSSAPASSNSTIPLQSRLHPCSG